MAHDVTSGGAGPSWNEVVVDEVLRRWMLGRSRPEKIHVGTLFLSLGVKFRFRQAVAPRRPRGKFMLGRLGKLKVATLRVAPGTLQLEAALAVAARTDIKNVFAFGTVSALDPALKIGEIVLAAGAIPGEGLSAYYDGPTPAGPDPALMDHVRRAAAGPLAAKEGVVYTTASLARIDDEFIKARKAQGAVGVDTAASALYRVAPHYGLAAVAALVVSDNPATGELCLTSKALMTRYERGVQRAFALLGAAARSAAPPEEERPRRRGLGLRRGRERNDRR